MLQGSATPRCLKIEPGSTSPQPHRMSLSMTTPPDRMVNHRELVIMNNSESNSFKHSQTPKLQSGCCDSCVGFIKDCDHCGQRIEILNGRPLNYHEGSIHRCGRGKN
ncbi:hypothetical protein BH18THE2_BH18THE2_25040 [soil metagenome]